MFTVYVLRSLKSGKRYVGSTAKEATARLKEHELGSNKWTSQNRPFKIIHVEKYGSRTEALKRERFLKSGQGRQWLNEKNI